MDDGRARPTTPAGAFAEELQIRLVEAEASLAAAEALDEPLLAQIAEGELADLRAMAARNDISVGDQPAGAEPLASEQAEARTP